MIPVLEDVLIISRYINLQEEYIKDEQRLAKSIITPLAATS